jgi:hypothetical protein
VCIGASWSGTRSKVDIPYPSFGFDYAVSVGKKFKYSYGIGK